MFTLFVTEVTPTSGITSFGLHIEWTGRDSTRWEVNFHSTGVRIEWNSLLNEWNFFTPWMEWIIHSIIFLWEYCILLHQYGNHTVNTTTIVIIIILIAVVIFIFILINHYHHGRKHGHNPLPPDITDITTTIITTFITAIYRGGSRIFIGGGGGGAGWRRRLYYVHARTSRARNPKSFIIYGRVQGLLKGPAWKLSGFVILSRAIWLFFKHSDTKNGGKHTVHRFFLGGGGGGATRPL